MSLQAREADPPFREEQPEVDAERSRSAAEVKPRVSEPPGSRCGPIDPVLRRIDERRSRASPTTGMHGERLRRGADGRRDGHRETRLSLVPPSIPQSAAPRSAGLRGLAARAALIVAVTGAAVATARSRTLPVAGPAIESGGAVERGRADPQDTRPGDSPHLPLRPAANREGMRWAVATESVAFARPAPAWPALPPLSALSSMPALSPRIAAEAAPVIAGSARSRGAGGVQVASLSADLPSNRSRLLLIETQKDLKRLGCLAGEVTGVSDEPTRAALARYDAVTGGSDETTPITPELLEELRSETGAICVSRPIVASVPSSGGAASKAPAAGSRPGRPQAERVATPAAHPAAKVAHAAIERRLAPAPAPSRRISRAQHLRQPPIRQAESGPSVRQTRRDVGGSVASASTASSTVAGLNGI